MHAFEIICSHQRPPPPPAHLRTSLYASNLVYTCIAQNCSMWTLGSVLLDYYGIRNDIHQCITHARLGYLGEHKKSSSMAFAQILPLCCLVFLRVPCLGHILFLTFINDLPDNINSTVRLFADDCVLYRNIRRSEDQQIHHHPANKLARWEETWLKWNSILLNITQWEWQSTPTKEDYHDYSLHNQVLENVSSARYLGITVTGDFDWGQHINNVISEATKTLGFLRRNLTLAPKETKVATYKSLLSSTRSQTPKTSVSAEEIKASAQMKTTVQMTSLPQLT